MARRRSRSGLGGLNLGVAAVTRATRSAPRRVPTIRQPIGAVGPHRVPVRPPRRAVPNVFHQRLGTVGPTGPQGTRRRAQAAHRVERAVARTPGHVRPPIIPRTPHYSPAARRNIDQRIQRYGRALARERGYSSPGAALRHGVDLRRQVPALRTAEARRQYAQTPQGHTLAQIGRRAVLAEARRSGVGAVLGVPQSGRGPYGSGQLRSQRATHAELQWLRQALRHAPQGSQIKLGRLLARARTHPTYDAAHSGYKKTSALAKASAFAFDPRRNAFIAAYQGLNQNSPQFRDLFGLPANAVTSTYNIAAGLAEAATGDTHRLRQLGSSFIHHDPLALLAQGKFGQAGRAALNAPFSTALEASGVAHGVARIGEGAARVGGRSLERGIEVKVPRTDIGGFRPFSNHAAVRVAQRKWVARQIRRSDQLRAESMRHMAAGNPKLARDLQQEASKIDPRVHVAREVRRRMDERVAASEDVRRAMRDQIIPEAHKARAEKNGVIQVLLNHGIVHADRADITAYLHELEAEYPGLVTKSQQVANHELRTSIEKSLSDPKLDLPHLEAKAREYAALMGPRQKGLVEADLGLAADQADRAKLVGYAVRRMGAHHDGDRLVDPNGNFLSTAAIKAHMADPAVGGGVQDPSLLTYLPQSPGSRGAGNFFRNFADPSQSVLKTQTRTGEAVRKGLFDAHPDVLVEHAANVEGLLAADRGFREFYREFGIHDEQGHVTRGTYADIVKVKREAEAATGRRLRPIRLQPWQGARLDEFLNAVTPQDAHGFHPEPVNDALLSAISAGQTGGPGKWGLIDEAAAKHLTSHLKVSGPDGVGRAAQVVNQAFRRTVLPFSVKWLTGNVAEAGLRYALLEHFNPVTAASDWRFGRKVLDSFDRQVDADVAGGRITAAEGRAQKAELRGRAVGGGHYAMNVRSAVHRSAEQFQGEAFHRLARVLGAFWRAPGPKQAASAFRTYTNWVMNTVNGTAERRFQAAMLGREARVNLLPSNVPTVAARAAEDAAKGLRGTNAQVRFGRLVDEAYGRYDKFSPTTRRMIGSVTPFIAWTLNAIRFVSHTLPADHPVVTALLAAGQHASQDWLLANGLYEGGKDSGALPGFLQGSIPTKGGHINASRYTPFGLYQDFAGSGPNLIFPQYSGAFEALQGNDWKGDPLKGVDTDWQKFGAAIQAFAESTVPIYAQWTQYHDRKGTTKERLLSQFYPFYPVADRTTSGGGGKPSGPSGGWTLPDTSSGPAPAQTWTLPAGHK